MSVYAPAISLAAALLLLRGLFAEVVNRGVPVSQPRPQPPEPSWLAVWAVLALALLSPWFVGFPRGKTPEEITRWRVRQCCVRAQTVARWGVAALFLHAVTTDQREAIGFASFGEDIEPEGATGIRAWLFFFIFSQVLSLVAPALLLVPEIRSFAASALTGFIDQLFFPGASEKRPPLSLKTAHALRMRRQFEKAERELERVLSHWPASLEAWTERLRLAIAAESAEAAQAVLADALRHLKTPEDKAAIFAIWQNENPPDGKPRFTGPPKA